MIKTKPIYLYIERNFMNSYSYKSLRNALNTPLRKDEEILISFILDWLRFRNRVIEEEFDLAYNKGWLPQYNVIRNNNCSNFLGIYNNYYKEASKVVLSNNLYNSAKDKRTQIKSSLNFILTKSFTEDEYKDVLYVFYCLHFYNTDILKLKKYKTSKIYNWIKVIKTVVENDSIYELYRQYLCDNNKEKYDSAIRMNYQINDRTYKDIVMTNLTENFFPETNIGQKYSYWKSYIESTHDTMKRSLFYSLYVRLPQKGSSMSNVISKGKIIVRLVYYWYYGIVEEHYVDTIFDILHGEYGKSEQTLMALLFANKNKSDKTALNYFKRKYIHYCTSRNISQDKQVLILKSSNNDYAQGAQANHSGFPLQLSKMPDGFTINKLQYLAKLLYDGNGKISLLATIESKNALPYFLGAPTTPKPPSNYKISWNKDTKSLKYFITRLYDTNTMHGVWKITRETFLIFSKGQLREINSAQSLSNLSSTGSKGYLNIDSKIKDFIDASIASAKSLK